jgi:FAD/FMN-containing dehydrogenase
MSQTSVSTLDLDALRGSITGRVIGPGDDGYDAARTVTTGGIDRHPAVIVQVADAEDVATVIGLARESGLELAVRSGGHSGAGHSVTEGGIVLDLRPMKDLQIDPQGRTAWAQTGLTAGEVTAAAAEHGLAVGFGDTGSVGIGGITLGGGVGYLVRKHGLTIDSLLAAELVTADGELLTVDEEHHPDLFWAIRGGGGNFGVATRFKYRLHELGGFVGGFLFLPASVDAMVGFMAAAEAAPDELSGILNVMPLPPMPMIPEAAHGKLGIMAMLAHVGDEDAGQRAMQPFRDLAEPYADLVRPMGYPEMYPPEPEEAYHPMAVARTMFIDRFDRGVAETAMQHLEASDAPMRAIQLRVLGGAMARVPADATAFAHRSSRIMVNVAAFYDGPQNLAEREAWVLGFVRDLQQDDHGAYVNFLVEEPERIRDAYPGATYDRLAGIKATYDPTNLFRLNQNIGPAGSS